MIIKRLGLPIALLIAAILSIEVTLTVLRQRNIEVTFSAHSAALLAAEPEAASEVSVGADDPVLLLAPDGELAVTVNWSYQIGPRFPTTFVQARVQNERGEIVAEEALSITCRNPLGCNGNQTLALRYGVREAGDQAEAWALGRYVVQVTRAYSGQAPVEISSRRLTVINP